MCVWCIVLCMRTNIVLDDDLIAEAMKYSTGRSKRGVVKEALATYVAVKGEQKRLETYRDRLASVRRRAADTAQRTPVNTLIRLDRERTR
jgi:Arc/MetJ family transcription regulator